MNALTEKAPVVVFTYRKQDFLEEIYQAILNYAPPKLYVVHNQHENDEEMAVVAAVRRAVTSWKFPFEIEYILRDQHLGINDSIGSALNDVFSREQSLIVLEDDTIPSPSFFSFCNAMLHRYARDGEVSRIIGSNLGMNVGPDTFFMTDFSIFCWGWASWADRWHLQGATELPWGSEGFGVVEKLSAEKELFSAFLRKLGPLSIPWDVRWGWTSALRNQKTVLPGINLVANKGFMAEGTYTNFRHSGFSDMDAGSLDVQHLQLLQGEGVSSEYEKRTAGLIYEILRHRGELALYKLA